MPEVVEERDGTKRRVLVTRAPHQASALAEELRRRGAEPVLLPVIEVAEPASWRPFQEALLDLDAYDWLLFTSANAVEVFLKRVEVSALSGRTQIGAIGAATARGLTAAGVRVDVIPPRAVAESFAEALLPRMRAGTKVLLVRAEQAREHLPEALRAAGAEVVIAPAYRTVIPAASVHLVRELFEHRPPDVAAFTSSSSVSNLLALASEAGVKLPATMRRVSIGPITSATMREAGLPPDAEALEANVVSLADACLSVA